MSPPRQPRLRSRWAGVLVTALALSVSGIPEARGESALQQTFATPEAAVRALVTATRALANAGERAERRAALEALAAVLGPESGHVIRSGDRVADQQGRQRFLRAYAAAHALEHPSEDKAILTIGPEGWPMPIPLVKTGKRWRFDTAAGKDEILNRRIGRNELRAIEICRAYVAAQRAYAEVPREGDGPPAYAQQFMSDPGKKNGLYWETPPGEEPSPMDPLVAQARAAGYGPRARESQPRPYYGYFYRIITAQGPEAPGGAVSYVVEGKMTGGFAMVAFPARYGNSGVMTFLVNHQGTVYEKDLGPDSITLGRGMRAYNPDSTWKEVAVPSGDAAAR